MSEKNMALRTMRLRHTRPAHTSTVRALAWSPDGQLASSDGETIAVWDAQGALCATVFTNGVHALAWSPDGHHLALGGIRACVGLLEVATAKEVARFPIAHVPPRRGLRPPFRYWTCQSLAYSPDGRWLLAGGSGTGHWLCRWDVSTGNRQYLPTAAQAIHAVAWSPDGQRFVAAGDGSALSLWSSEGEPLDMPFAEIDPQTAFRAVAWSPAGTRLAVALADHTLGIWFL